MSELKHKMMGTEAMGNGNEHFGIHDEDSFCRQHGCIPELIPPATFETLLTDLTHTRSCPKLNPCDDDACTCALDWRIRLRTEMTLRNAWEKRAYQAERELADLKQEVGR